MDDPLAKLERALQAKPDDEVLALEYYAALRRAGKKLEPLNGDRFEFECTKRWHELERSTKDFVRYCGDCKKDVYFAANEQEFSEHAKAGHCVSILQSKLDPLFDQIPKLGKNKSLPVAGETCLVIADWKDLYMEAFLSVKPYYFDSLGQPQLPKAEDFPKFAQEMIEQRLTEEDYSSSVSDLFVEDLLNEAYPESYERFRDSPVRPDPPPKGLLQKLRDLLP